MLAVGGPIHSALQSRRPVGRRQLTSGPQPLPALSSFPFAPSRLGQPPLASFVGNPDAQASASLASASLAIRAATPPLRRRWRRPSARRHWPGAATSRVRRLRRTAGAMLIFSVSARDRVSAGGSAVCMPRSWGAPTLEPRKPNTRMVVPSPTRVRCSAPPPSRRLWLYISIHVAAAWGWGSCTAPRSPGTRGELGRASPAGTGSVSRATDAPYYYYLFGLFSPV